MSIDIHALSGAYAVDALDERERAEFEGHLAECASCRAEVDGLREAAAALASLEPVAPPAELRERVLASVAVVRPLPPAPTADPEVGPGRSARTQRRWWTGALLVAAAAVLAVAVSWHPWPSGSGSGVPGVGQVMAAADVQQIGRTLPDGATVTVYRSPSLNRAAVITHDLPPLGGHRVYELWLEDRTGTMRPAGLLPAGPDAETVLDGAAAAARAAGITVEPAGGSTAPTTTPIAVLGFGRA